MAQVRAGTTTLRRPDPDDPESELAYGVVVLQVKDASTEANIVLETPEHRNALLGDLIDTLDEGEREELVKTLTGSSLVIADAADLRNLGGDGKVNGS